MKNKILFNYVTINNFSKLSGDYNPLHSKHSNLEYPVIHGMLIVLKAIENIDKKSNAIASIRVSFENFLYLNQIITFKYSYKNKKFLEIEGYYKKIKIVKIYIKFSEKKLLNKKNCFFNKIPPKSKINTFNHLNNNSNKIKLYSSEKLLKNIFPQLNIKLNSNLISLLLCLTRIVGMKMPGMYSIFSSFNINLSNDIDLDNSLNFKLNEYDPRWSYLKIDFHNKFCSGEICAFERPKPTFQPTYKEIKKKLKKMNFKNKKALVIGGSNGIGEVCVKILSYYGAKVTFTYFKDQKNSKCIKNDCQNKYLKFIKFDANNFNEKKLVQLINKEKFDQIYYFATPKIFNEQSEQINIEILGKFFKFYILNAINLLNLIDDTTSKKVNFLLASTVVTDQKTYENNLKEYTLIKKFSEQIFNLNIFQNIKVNIFKFNRVKTNQTISIHKLPEYHDIVIETNKAISLMI